MHLLENEHKSYIHIFVWQQNNLSSSISGEKKSPKKPHRFSSCLPDSQELINIRNKKKVTEILAKNYIYIYTHTQIKAFLASRYN